MLECKKLSALQLLFHRIVCNSGASVPTERSYLSPGVWLLMPVGSWSPSVNSAYIQYRANVLIDCTSSASTAQEHLVAVVVQENQLGGIRLDYCVRVYTNRENLI